MKHAVLITSVTATIYSSDTKLDTSVVYFDTEDEAATAVHIINSKPELDFGRGCAVQRVAERLS